MIASRLARDIPEFGGDVDSSLVVDGVVKRTQECCHFSDSLPLLPTILLFLPTGVKRKIHVTANSLNHIAIEQAIWDSSHKQHVLIWDMILMEEIPLL
jgi:hypothetical protein